MAVEAPPLWEAVGSRLGNLHEKATIKVGSTLARAVAIVKGGPCGRMAVHGEVVLGPRVCRSRGRRSTALISSRATTSEEVD